ncbi:uncharacterized protein LOC126681802 [Mercurialis annua]|uniref:uncharacterized protein LOC126681800 n=1 Tax=Mercurialis annua TaxID=3986 RepID=UPI0021605622|nr:uncharacterized protein LOC126681800 [Mercurialis annua]XP_050233313.1 uncharacterized protein LOC126681802 [Mercurialis annua]
MLSGIVTAEEIKRDLFSINDDKAPRPDGFGSAFYKKVMEFFNTGRMLKQANSTSRRLSCVLDRIISKSQSAFIPGRSIADNILLAHELVRNYHRQKGESCAMKVDLQKAYDTVEWDFIEEVMMGLNIDNKFINLVMTCIRSAMFSVQVNGESCG